MTMTVQAAIQERIASKHPGKVWTAKALRDIAPLPNIRVALNRMAKSGILRRIDWGLYDSPRMNSLLKSHSPPDHREIIAAVAERDGARVLMDGITAANELGLTNAVPAKVEVLTDARIKPIQLGNMTITFRPAAASRLFWAGRPAGNIIQALNWLRDTMDTNSEEVMSRLREVLNDPKVGAGIRADLMSGISNIPEWMGPYITDLLSDEPESAPPPSISN